MTIVTYKGTAPLTNDLLGNHIPLGFNTIPASVSQIQAGQLRAIAVTGEQRLAQGRDRGLDVLTHRHLIGNQTPRDRQRPAGDVAPPVTDPGDQEPGELSRGAGDLKSGGMSFAAAG